VGSLLFDPDDGLGLSTPPITITFNSGQTLGPAGGNGNAVTNNSTSPQTMIMPNGTVQGGATGAANTAFQFSGASTYLLDGNPNVDGAIEIGTSSADSLTLKLSNSNAGIQGTFYGAITGSGSLITGPGVGVFFNGVNTYLGGTVLNSSYLYTTANLMPTSGPGVTLNGGSWLFFTDTSGSTTTCNQNVSADNNVQNQIYLIGGGTVTLSGNLTGGLGVNLAASGSQPPIGKIILTGANTYSGPSSISIGGVLQGTSTSISSGSSISYLGGGGTLKFTDSSGGTPTWAGTIIDNSGGGTPLTVEHNGMDTLTLSQPLTGNIGVGVTSNGTLSLSGSASYTGPTNIGTDGTLRFQGASSTLSGPITGGGTLSVRGGASLTLTSSANTNTGPLRVDGSELILTSASAFGTPSSINFNNGTFNMSRIPLSGGNQTVRPVGMSLAGTNTFAMGINGTNSTIMDLTNSGSLNLSRVNLQVINNSPSALYGPSQEVTLFSNTGVQTTFNQVTLLGLDAFTGTLDTSTLNTIKYVIQKKSDENVKAVTNTSIVTGHTAFKMAQVLTSTLNTQRQGMRNEGTSFGGISFFQGNPLKAPDVDVSYLSLTDGGLDRAVEENMKCWNPLGRKKTSLWAQPFGIVLNQGMVDGNPGFSSRTGGILFGMDHKVNSGLLVGGGLGYAYTKMSIDENLGRSRVKDRFGTVFASFFGEAWHVDLALVGGLQHHRGYRTVQGTNLQVQSQHDGYQIMPHVGAGYTFGMHDCYQIHTFAQLDYVYSHENRYQEQGANILNYFIEAHDSSMLRSEVGFHVAQICDLETAQWLRSIKLSLINKAPLKKGPIVSSYGDSAQSTSLNTTFISPGVKSTLQYSDGFSVGFNYNAEISFTNKTTSQELILQAGKKF
jgi:hypothetical protein